MVVAEIGCSRVFARKCMEHNEEFLVSASDKMPQMDAAYDLGSGYVAENELMRAIILRTIEDFKSGGELRDMAIMYMLDPDEEYIFSFRFICRYLGFDPEKTSGAIMNATHRISTRRRAA
jgi:hypothetical protein